MTYDMCIMQQVTPNSKNDKDVQDIQFNENA